MSEQEKSRKVVTRLEKLTPRKAQELLQQSADNRPRCQSYVEYLVGAMKAGCWTVNGETIKIDSEERLQDGQHRCAAVIASGVTIETFVTRGLPCDVFETVDMGRKRTIGHVLARRGEKNYSLLASALILLHRFKTGEIKSTNRPGKPRHDEALTLLEQFPEIRESIQQMPRTIRQLMPVSAAVTLHYLFSKKDSAMADEFFTKLAEGERLTKTMAVYWLQKRLVENLKTKAKLPRLEILALTIKAWNFHRNGKACRALRWRAAGENGSEPFPEIE